MRSCGWYLAAVMAVVVQGQWACAQDDEDDRDDRGDEQDERDDDGDARNYNCTSEQRNEELRGTLNVTARCELSGADVRGDVILFAGGSLIARDTRIRGSLEASRADFVELDGVRVDRNVSLRDLVGDRSAIVSSDLRGSVVLTSNRSRFEIVDNEVRNDLGAFGNTGGLQIASNDIGGDLNCTGNVPAPTVLANRIEGDAQGQCGPAQPTENPPPQPIPAPMPPSPPTPRPSGAAAPPPPSTPTLPSASPPVTPEPAPPPATPAPLPATPAPPAAATPPAAEENPPLDDGGAGAVGWPLVALLLPLVARRRLKRAREVRDRPTA